jgi:enterochelin esterase-like enzyme
MLVQELKPYVDQHYRTLPGPQHTAVMGSSMGGLVSLYAMQRCPEVSSLLGSIFYLLRLVLVLGCSLC